MRPPARPLCVKEGHTPPACVQELDRFPAGLPYKRTKLVAWQLLRALTYMHNMKIVHRWAEQRSARARVERRR